MILVCEGLEGGDLRVILLIPVDDLLLCEGEIKPHEELVAGDVVERKEEETTPVFLLLVRSIPLTCPDLFKEAGFDRSVFIEGASIIKLNLSLI